MAAESSERRIYATWFHFLCGWVEFSIIMIWVAFVTSGCLPLEQSKLAGSQHEADISIYDNRRCFIVQLIKPRKPGENKIIGHESYITSPSGNKFGIDVEPLAIDVRKLEKEIRQKIYPTDTTGSRVRIRKNGVWSVYLVIDTAGERWVIEEQVKVSTFYYNPIIHGPPN